MAAWHLFLPRLSLKRLRNELLHANQSTRGASEIDAWAGGLPKPAANGFPNIAVRFANGGSATNIRKLAYVQLNSQTPCPPRSAVPVNQGRQWKFSHFCSASSLSVMAATAQAMSPKAWQHSPRPVNLLLMININSPTAWMKMLKVYNGISKYIKVYNGGRGGQTGWGFDRSLKSIRRKPRSIPS